MIIISLYTTLKKINYFVLKLKDKKGNSLKYIASKGKNY